MRILVSAALIVCAPFASLAQAQKPFLPAGTKETDGLKSATLRRAPTGSRDRPQFLSVTVLPDHGMDIFQITADLPGQGETQLLASPSLSEAARKINQADAVPWSYASYGFGAAILLPWASRISGAVSPVDNTLLVDWRGRQLKLRANSSGKYAVHGLIEQAHVENLQTTTKAGTQSITGILHAGDFGGHWLSSTDVRFTIALGKDSLDVKVEAMNVGTQSEPIAVGWHPYFALPGHDRARARLYVAAQRYAETIPSDGLTTGVLLETKDSSFDFLNAQGSPLPYVSMNVNFSGLNRKGCVARLIDATSNYGLCIRAVSPAIHTVQVYSPKDASFVAIEPQFNFPDPLGKEWGGMETGLETLAPSLTAVWHVRLELFTPQRTSK